MVRRPQYAYTTNHVARRVYWDLCPSLIHVVTLLCHFSGYPASNEPSPSSTIAASGEQKVHTTPYIPPAVTHSATPASDPSTRLHTKKCIRLHFRTPDCCRRGEDVTWKSPRQPAHCAGSSIQNYGYKYNPIPHGQYTATMTIPMRKKSGTEANFPETCR
jgi:hypothetical protein